MKCGFAAINGKHFDPQKLGRCAICGRKAVVEEAVLRAIKAAQSIHSN